MGPGVPYYLITVRYGIAEGRALISWCDESLAALAEHQAQKNKATD